MSAISWPEEIELPDKIGVGQYRYSNGRPCCSLGHYHAAFGTITDVGLPENLYSAYQMCARVLYPDVHEDECVSYLNDKILSPKERVLVYAAALAYVGYSIPDYPEAEELARKSKEKYDASV